MVEQFAALKINYPACLTSEKGLQLYGDVLFYC